jgi:hypothetical protein
MDQDADSVMRDVRALVDDVRAQCLWFLRDDYYPHSPAEACRVLEAIERHGDLESFRKAAVLRQWLSRPSSSPSAA